GYTIGPVTWTYYPNVPVGYDDFFDTNNHQYMASFTLTADAGKMFASYLTVQYVVPITDISVTVQANLTKADVFIVFPKTAP
ncbi:MAG: hypothetical protein LBQ38_13405, partial [Spirochaetaceae bacterium]|nr:hypothetical protein [Spirochaetaceae bacterium]